MIKLPSLRFDEQYRLPITIGGIFLIGLIIGIIIPIDILPPQIITYKEQRNQYNYKFINPLLECDTDNSYAQNTNLHGLKQTISSLVNNHINKGDITFASVYYRDLNNGPWFGINQDELFSPASLVKVPVMMTYYKLAESDPTILPKIIHYKLSAPDTSQNIKPTVTLTPNTDYTVDELIRRMIIYSDNQAYDLLVNNLDNQTLIHTYTDLGINISKAFTDPNGNIISVGGYSSFFRILYNASYLSKSYSEKALNLLSQVEYHQALIAKLPPSTIVSHKFGERNYLDTGEKQLHDCGIVYLPKKPYLICIMTRGQNFSNLNNIIAEISGTIYQNLSKN